MERWAAFKREVLENPNPASSREARLEALKRFEPKDGEPCPARNRVGDVLAQAQRIERRMRESKRASVRSSRSSWAMFPPPPPGEIIRQEQIVEALMPEVEALREKHFGSRKPPFPDYRRLKEWVDENNARHAKEQAAARTANSKERFRLEREIWVRLEKLNALGLGFYGITKTSPGFSCPVAANSSNFLFSARSPELMSIGQASKELAQMSGFEQAEIVDFILTGERPFQPAIEVRAKPRTIGRRGLKLLQGRHYQYVEIRVFSADVSSRELKEAGDDARSLLGVTERSALREKDLALWDSYKEAKRQLPDSANPQLFAKVLEELQRRGYGLKGNGSPVKADSTRIAWLRLETRLKKEGLL